MDAFINFADKGNDLIESGDYQAAISVLSDAKDMYRGDYLAEDLYNSWATGERERLRERYIVVLTELSEAYAKLGQYRRAINVCQQILS